MTDRQAKRLSEIYRTQSQRKIADKVDMPAISAWIKLPLVSVLLTMSQVLIHAELNEELPPITETTQIQALFDSKQAFFGKARLSGMVLFADPLKSKLALQDESGIAVIRADLPPGIIPHAGDQILVEGACATDGREFTIGRVPVVDNDGLHSLKEISGSVFLKAGRHPIRLGWFDAGGDATLEVFWAGPGLPRQKIPSSALFRATRGAQEMSWTNGLEYREYDGEWSTCAGFRSHAPVQTGIAKNLDIELRRQTNNVGLEFAGYLDIPREGTYTFWTVSDDGSQLFIDEQEARFQWLGKGQLPEGHSLAIGQPLPKEPQWMRVQGKVVFAGRKLDGWELELEAHNQRIMVQFPKQADCAPEAWLHSEVRVSGVALSAYTPEGLKIASRLLSPGPEQILLMQVGSEQWATPIESISDFLKKPNQVAPWAHLRAEIRSVQSANRLLLADETGEVSAQFSEPFEPGLSGWIELLGQRQSSGAEVLLKQSVYRKTAASDETKGRLLPVLTTVEQVQALKRDEAQKGYPVLVRAVVTCAWDWNVNGMIQDATRGIFVPNLSPGSAAPARTGDYLEVEGRTAPGDFAPVIEATRVTWLGRGRLPEPVRPTWDQLLNGSLDCQFVELEGVVTSVQTDGMTILMRGGRLSVELENWETNVLASFENAHVRIRGSLSASWDGDTHQVMSGRILLHALAISVEEPAPLDLFATPAKSINELKQFDAAAGALKRVKLSGQIVQRYHDEYYLAQGTNGARFLPKLPIRLRQGDRVEVVGFAEIDGPSALLRDASVRKIGSAPLPPAQLVNLALPLEDLADAMRIQLDARVLATHWDQGETVLELQEAGRTFVARFESPRSERELAPMGSQLRLTGVCRRGPLKAGSSLGSFELLLNSPQDIAILARPSWWTATHAIGLVAILAGVLLLAVGWIRSLRTQVEQRTAELQHEMEQHQRTEAEVREKAKLLAAEIEERKRAEQEVERVHKQLLTTWRQAGMAEVATSILHNVGNVLNSVNVSAEVVAESLRQSKAPSLLKLADLLNQHAAETGFLVSNEKGKQVPGFLRNLGEHLKSEQEGNVRELQDLQKNIEHIKSIVAMQQDHARLGGAVERVRLSEVIEDSIRINAGALTRHGIELVRQFHADADLLIERHKVLQILVNLLQNAKLACAESQRTDSQIIIKIPPLTKDRVFIQVIDNGVGIAKENLSRLFTAGFTTRKNGHGFGLHGAILAAKELKGDLLVQSEGTGKGSTFTLELPLTGNGQPR